jgi:hypothetical protein
MTRRKISLITAVWGEWHTETFLQLNLKALLSRHNLLALAALHSVSLIYEPPTVDLEGLVTRQACSCCDL